ncbi:alpha/beta hydrolase domain-containing protein [Coprinopsis marcescibilis]|uniref:Alpha/beta hydrolase domain-containing protein n=1 Tax=Coprinopsis marcescibilis TaxID=230819 RepID=A0A5C3KEN2_COPMA|nr:alpha/beta hydrolase domain-containing protein [Coprinopsis marcescibilis]
MEEISQIKGRDIPDVMDASISILAPLLTKNKAYIQEIPFKTFKYGPTDRHQLDIYYPLEENKREKTPVLFFIYGGSFNSGERNLSAKFGLVYACVGSFFARRGILTVIADYRLAPQFKFPKPVEDIRDAITWVLENPTSLESPGSPSPDLHNLIVMGHSAGATHAATLLFYPNVVPLDSDVRARITGLVLFAGGYDVSAAVPGTARAKAVEAYWGTLDEAFDHDALSLFNGFLEENLLSLPPIVMVQAAEEPDYMDAAGKKMRQALTTRLGREQRMIIAEGHNHISVNWVLGIGQGEQWAQDVADWISKVPKDRI